MPPVQRRLEAALTLRDNVRPPAAAHAHARVRAVPLRAPAHHVGARVFRARGAAASKHHPREPVREVRGFDEEPRPIRHFGRDDAIDCFAYVGLQSRCGAARR